MPKPPHMPPIEDDWSWLDLRVLVVLIFSHVVYGLALGVLAVCYAPWPR